MESPYLESGELIETKEIQNSQINAYSNKTGLKVFKGLKMIRCRIYV